MRRRVPSHVLTDSEALRSSDRTAGSLDSAMLQGERIPTTVAAGARHGAFQLGRRSPTDGYRARLGSQPRE